MPNLDDTIKNDWLYTMPDLYETLFSHDNNLPALLACYLNQVVTHKFSNVLELGCGTGRNLHALSEIFSHRVGVDLASEMLEYGRQYYPGIKFIEKDIRALNLETTFDLILCIGSVLMHACSINDLNDYIAAMMKHSRFETNLFITLLNKEKMLQALKQNNYSYQHNIKYKEVDIHIQEKFTLIDANQLAIEKTIIGLQQTQTSTTYSYLFDEDAVANSLQNHGFATHSSPITITEDCKLLNSFNTCIFATYQGLTNEH